ncbi:SusC/RagA family TonB-linked outer membrane protein [Cytophagaceae bacterium YF14B1]|uniref:SusC/RagA family TonB-linked outer membrane protein n=1 Tax=Xanthocytophaga flava TaxID=3048013 RepID=A0AAE3QKN0_9BACT|nr:SusC/RagA family TonB-linked outer membrane protein [Xanthocytophaga flavus]MDJ1480675.1 SusC/RagA family TonB-linked outer membrane protein [Xanthocytophaga flavus]
MKYTIHLFLICCLYLCHWTGLAAQAQIMASSEVFATGSRQISSQGRSLKSVITELENRYKVVFFYDTQLIKNVAVSQTIETGSLDKVLSSLLKPYNLKYKRLKGSSYVIFSDTPLKDSGNNDTISPESRNTADSLTKNEVYPQVLSVNQEAEQAAITIKGKITDENKEALPGVSVVLKGTTTGTVAGPDGNYSLSVPDGNGTLVFSFVGYISQEVSINNRTTIDISLAPDITALNEVVVVGYGTQKKGEITSAVASVNAEQFNKGNISNVSQLLQGKVAGLSISRPGGDPNGNFAIRLRGLSTLGANTQPLVVIDGQIGADLNTVDPNDIKSIDVLKDGSAAAIYGTRGSAGVIIITTKSGGGTTSISYNGLVQAESAARLTPHMSAAEFRALGKGTDYGSNTDWYKEITRTAISQTHNVSLSGGNSSGTSYNASVNYRNSQGVAITTGFEQLNGRLNLIQKALKDRLVLNLTLSMTRRKSELGFNEAFKYAAIYNPTSPVYSTDPLYDLTGGGYFEANFVDYSNPVAVLRQNTNERELKRFNFAASAEYEIVTGLKFLIRYAQQTASTYNQVYLPRTSYNSRNFLGVSGFARGGYGWKNDNESFNQLYENTLSYEKRIDKLQVSALTGYSYQDFLDQGFTVGGGNFITDASGQNLSSALDFAQGLGAISSFKNGSRLVAFFGRVNLNYNGLAFLSATLRREGSTQFGANHKWGMFPGVSAGVDLSQILRVKAIDNLKLRASYGVTGALPPSSYLSLRTLTAGGSYFYAGDGVYLQPYSPNQNANPDLRWEKKGEFDVGVDFGLFNNRLTGTIDYYQRTTSDLIFNVTVPVPPNLVPTTWMNIGTMKSNGFEMSLGYDVIKNDVFSWNTGGNFTTFHVVLSKLDPQLAGSFVGATNLGTPGQEATQITRAVEGEKIGILWGKVYKGVGEDGKYIFEDRNNDGKIDNQDETIIGNGLPKFEFGWNNTIRYKNFDFNFLLRGSIGHDLINTYRAFYENPNVASSYNIVKTKYFNPNITDGQIFSSRFVERASFAKLDNATLGYNFKLPAGSLVKSLRAYLSGQNLFTITNYTGVDPEVRYADESTSNTGAVTRNALAPGVDRRETWVLTRSFTLGVNVQF